MRGRVLAAAALYCASALNLGGLARADSGDDLDAKLRVACPAASEARDRQHARDAARRRALVAPITRPALRQELLLRAKLDQDARRASISAGNAAPDVQFALQSVVDRVDEDNGRRLRHILIQDGFPRIQMVDYDGVEAAWLLLQHLRDRNVQVSVLPTIKAMEERGEVAGQDYALLLDRTMIRTNRKQVYGTQLTGSGADLEVLPVQDPAQVDAERQKLGMVRLEEYLCIARFYNSH